MFCPKCGNEVQVGTRFCGKCGAVLNCGEQEQPKERAGGSAAGERATGGRTTEDKPAGGGLAGAETLAQTRETGRKLGTKLSRWLADYIDTWRGLGKLGGRERYIWLGIHGGAALVFVCILVAMFAVSASGTGGTARLNAEKLLKEVTEISRRKKCYMPPDRFTATRIGPNWRKPILRKVTFRRPVHILA